MPTSPAMRFNRCVPEALIEVLSPGAPFHFLVELARNPPDLTKPVDLQLRADPNKKGAGRPTLYIGLTKAVDLDLLRNGRFSLIAQTQFETVTAAQRDAWKKPQPLGGLADDSAAISEFVLATIGAAREEYVDKEGGLQVALSQPTDDFVVIDRESKLHFLDTKTRDEVKSRLHEPVTRAFRALSVANTWASSTQHFGDKLDALAIDETGRVLLIEAKDGSDTHGVGRTPAQVGFYLLLFQALVKQSAPELWKRCAECSLNGFI